MNTATRATSIKNNSIRATGFFIRRKFPIKKSIISSRIIIRARRHHIKNKRDEKDRDRNNKKSATESIDLIGEWLLTSWTFEHFAEFGFGGVVVGGRRSGLNGGEFGGGKWSVTDLTVAVGGGGGARWSLILFGILWGIQLCVLGVDLWNDVV